MKRAECTLDHLADATVRIECGDNSGSGFHFLREEIVLSNCHVVEAHLVQGTPIAAHTECGETSRLELIGYSLEDDRDFAVLKVGGTLGAGRKVLEPMEVGDVPRGTEVAFSGFPHGVSHLLVHKGFVSGRCETLGFYIDGNVNPGNSGGPIVDIGSGKVVGIASARRFVGAQDMKAICDECAKLTKHLHAVASQGGVQIMGVDFVGFAGLMAQSLELVKRALDANANTGIGIGYHIRFALDKCRELGLC